MNKILENLKERIKANETEHLELTLAIIALSDKTGEPQ